ncbi:hypothetical protein BXZ70DRAFT_895536 [Cristinia sonorae]|uniref:Uncharacterized protein n=1 Tax=Cristinia sonorae TaxID=1940300 RepID=A0A8K0XP19_9AGAR|nr:hypothetical protein BXZ70DRAFT_895536 [Cristinia sonorae]
MRNTLPLHFRSQSPAPTAATPPHQQHVPTIRLISATPSMVASSSSFDASTSFSAVAPFASSTLAPKRLDNDAEVPRKRLVPKKSKLGLLSSVGSSKAKDKGNKDFSDVVRRVGAPNTASTGRGGFEIYVDQADDPDIGEIVVVKKKKSRLALDGMKWGALGEVTNVPPTVSAKDKNSKAPVENLLKVKGEDSQKWWSIGRGRKDSKEKSKENVVKEKERDESPPEPFQPVQNRSRFNSLGSATLLSQSQGTVSSVQTLLVPSTTPTAVPSPTEPHNNLLAPPSSTGANGSIAVRAMKSMRSLARMKSWATLSGAPTSDKEGDNTHAITNSTTTNGKTKDTKEEGKEKKKKKEKKDKSDKTKTVRLSGSSFEAGTLSAQASPMPSRTLGPNSVGGMNVGSVTKKQSILGLGLPSTLRLNVNSNTVRQVSVASSNSSVGAPSSILNTNGRLSVDSAHLIMGPNGRPSSTISSGSSLRPPSTASGVSAFSGRSARSSSSSVASVKWDEQGIRNLKDKQREERKSRRDSGEGKNKDKDGKSTRRSSEGRQRKLISDIFPEVQTTRSRSVSPPSAPAEPPIVRVEAATLDGHEAPGDEPCDDDSVHVETPVKRARPRPVSEQLLGKLRPQAIHGGDDGDGVLSILDAATNDLASLINRLDLEATPASCASTNASPLSVTNSPARALLPVDDSPIKKRTVRDTALIAELRESVASISSLRPYALAQAQSQTVRAAPVTRQQAFKPTPDLIGQNIAPWSALDWKVSPRKPTTRPVRPKHMTHKRTITPLPANDEPPSVFQPLQPLRPTRNPIFISAASSQSNSPEVTNGEPSSQTFGSSKPSRIGLRSMSSMGEDDSPAPSPTPAIFKRGNAHIRAGSVFSVMGHKRSNGSSHSASSALNASISSATKKVLGMSGTLGGSTEPSVNPEDPDSDIPDELQVILSGQSDEELTQALDNLSMHRLSVPPSPIIEEEVPLPPEQVLARQPSLPVFRATLLDEDANNLGDVEDGSEEEDETKKSFDFTGELKKLNESGASDRASFVEQLENAFRTPARIDLGLDDGFLKAALPPLPPLPLEHRSTPGDDIAPRTVSSGDFTSSVEEDGQDREVHYPLYREPDTLDQLLAECHEDVDEDDDMCMSYNPQAKRSNGSMRSKASDGQLNTSFRFGGRPSIPPSVVEEAEEKPLTLSDIIPPVGHHSRSHSSASSTSNLLEDISVLNSIMAHVTSIPSLRRRANSDTSLQMRPPADVSHVSSHSNSSHSRAPSEVSMASFTGFDSFDEVRRGFEFGPNRPAFFPPPGATRPRPSHNRFESIYSIASVSSYGATLNSGEVDPFGYGPSRPVSEDYSISLSMTVDDTFAYRRNARRSRVESDASNSSFYFPVNGRRGHRRHESNMSTVSNHAPPVSIYNRSFGAHIGQHKRNDSNTSANSVAQSYAVHGRAAWARHRPDFSVDSVSSDFSGRRLGRPGLGDRMFEMDHGVPLTAISASPPESLSGSMMRDRTEFNQTEFDSIMDADDRRYSIAEDSLFERTGYKSEGSYSEDESVFGYDGSRPQINVARQFRPLSMMSVASIRPGDAQDDTMVTMIGGGRAPVRRRSVESLMDASPLYKAGLDKNKKDRKKDALEKVGRVLNFDMHEDVKASPLKESPRLMQKPSIASTSSQQFGGERMIMARKGLLERQSLEDSAIMAQGEDLLASLRSHAVFSRPGPASRSRSSTVTTSSSGAETPPLSASDGSGSSVSGDSQSSIDIAHLNSLLSTFDPPTSGIARARARARARGTGHRRRISQARASRSSVYETIQEESYVYSSSPMASPAPTLHSANATKAQSPVVDNSVYVVDSDSQSLGGSIDWSDDKGIVGLRKYFALKGEADETVRESKRTWQDTPFSIFAIQSFEPPQDPTAMQAMLEHSQKNYGPLPSELHPRRIRSRTSSRASPYPTRALKATLSPDRSRTSVFVDDSHHEYNISKPFASPPPPVPALSEITINPNLSFLSTVPVLDIKPFSPFACNNDKDTSVKNIDVNKMGLPARPRVTSSARRTALGWTKRSNGKSSSSDQKENVSQGSIATPGETLRISRPRPRGRPTPGRPSAIRA